MTIRSILPALFAASLLTLSGSAAAQSKTDFSTVRFYPSVGVGTYIGLDGAQVGRHKQTSYGAIFDYSANTLEVDRPCDGIRNLAGGCRNDETAFVRSTGLLHLFGSFTIKGRTQVSFDLPLGFTDAGLFSTRIASGAANPTLSIQPHQGFAFADARLAAKTHIWSSANNELRFGATAFTTLPTAMITSNGDCRTRGNCTFLGERGVQAGAYGIAEYARGDFRGAVNVGAMYRPDRDFLTLKTGTEILYGVAGMYSVTPLVHGKLELAGNASIRAKDYPLEARGQLEFGDDLVFKVGAGAGLVGDVGNPTYRVFAGAQWTPMQRDQDGDGIDDRRDACPNDPEDRDGHMDGDGCPDFDNDGDGIPDDKDACPNEAEDLDGFADEDGCPDPDNDGDGVPDGYDSCEGEMEDIDGDRDDDGCPDLDRDFDGIDDAVDLCPDAPEDRDGLADHDGCPEDDFDGDGILDVVDACPDAAENWNDLLDEDGCPEDDEDEDGVPDQLDQCPGQAETLNGKADHDGCPDGTRLMVLQGQKLLPTATASFEGNVLRGSSFLVEAATDFIKRSHKRGSVHVVVIAPADDTRAAARAAELAAALQRRSNRTVTSAHIPGTPVRVELELVPPGLKALPRAPAPAAPAPAASDPATPAPATPAAPASDPAAPAPATPAAPAPAPEAPPAP